MASWLADISVTYYYIIRLLNLSCVDLKKIVDGRTQTEVAKEAGLILFSSLEKAVDMLID